MPPQGTPRWEDLTPETSTGPAATLPDQTVPVPPDIQAANRPSLIDRAIHYAGQIPPEVIKRGLSFIPAAASTIGGTMGATRGGVPGATVGAGLGNVAGEVIRTGLEAATVGPPSVEETMQRLRDVPGETAFAMAAEPVAAGITSVGRPIARVLSAPFTPTATIGRIARATRTPEGWEAAQFTNGQVMPHEISSSPLLKLFGNMIEGSPLTQSQYRTFIESRNKDFITKAEDLITSVGERAKRQEGGEVIKQAQVQSAMERARTLISAGQRRGSEIKAQAESRATGLQSDALAQAQALQREAADVRTAAREAFEEADNRYVGATGDVEEALSPEVWGHERVGNLILGMRTYARDAAEENASELFKQVWKHPLAPETLDYTPLLTRGRQLGEEAAAIGRATGTQGPAARPLSALRNVEDAATEQVATAQEAYNKVTGRDVLQGMIAKLDPLDPRRARLERELTEISTAFPEPAGADLTIKPEQMNALQSYYGRMARQLKGTPEGGVFAQLFKSSDEVMQQLPEEMYDALRHAKDEWKAMKDTYDRYVLGRVAKMQPQAILDVIMPTGRKGAPDQIRTVRDTLGPEAWDRVQAQKWFDLAYTPDGSPVTPAQLLKRLQGVDQETLHEIFGGSANLIERTKQLIPDLQAAASKMKGAEGDATKLLSEAERVTTRGETAAERAIAQGDRQAATLDRRVQRQGVRAIEKEENRSTHSLVARSLADADAAGAAKLREIVGPEDWKTVQSVDLQYLFGRMEQAGADQATLIEPEKLFGRLQKRGEDAFVATHSRQLWDQVQAFTRNWQKLSRGAPGGAGKMWIQLRTPGAIGATMGGLTQLMTGDPSKAGMVALGTGGAVILGPKLLARIFTSPAMRAELLKGMSATARKDASVAVRALTQLTTQLTREGLISAVGGPGNQTIRTVDSPAGGRGAGPGMNTGPGGAPPSVAPQVQGPTVRGAVPLWDTLEAEGVMPGGSAGAVRQATQVGQPPPTTRR